MHVDYTPKQKALRAEIRAYFSELMAPELRLDLEGGLTTARSSGAWAATAGLASAGRRNTAARGAPW